MAELAASPEEDLEDGRRAATPDGDNLVLDYARAISYILALSLRLRKGRAGG